MNNVSTITPRLRLAFEFLLYAVLTAIMLWATWLTWPDAFIDFSRELRLPWRVSRGDVLYRDLAYYFGPVSIYTNAALFALLERSSIHISLLFGQYNLEQFKVCTLHLFQSVPSFSPK